MYVFAPPLSIPPIPSETIHLLSLSLSLTHSRTTKDAKQFQSKRYKIYNKNPN